MQEANTLLRVIAERGFHGQPLERLYRHLFNRDLYLIAYSRLYRNAGSMTPGSTTETVDAMSLAKIDAIIQALRNERYRWTPVRRVMIPKANGNLRPLGVPTWSDKLLQEVIRLLLNAYYDPQFSHTSHGFRPERGCHTALRTIAQTWTGTTWFIEGDIAQCFDRLDHDILLGILAERIHDGRFMRLLKQLLHAGYLEGWHYHRTLSGVPQGSIIGPILTNIYLDRFDRYITTTLIPHYTRGQQRARNKGYSRIHNRMSKLRNTNRQSTEEYRDLLKRRRRTPSVDVNDPLYRRLRYVRYADDFLLGFSGPHDEAVAIKTAIDTYLREALRLELSATKTLITHGRTAAARFLGYEVMVQHCDTKVTNGRRSINGDIGLKVPASMIRSKMQRYCRNGKPIHRPAITVNTAFSIVTQYQQEYRGLVQYYRLASNLSTRFSKLRWVMECSLTKTLAAKLRISVAAVYRRYQTTINLEGQSHKVLQIVVERPDKKPLVTHWGGISLRWSLSATVTDTPTRQWNLRHSEIVQRLLADTCELCGTTGPCEVHHIHALRDIQKQGQQAPPRWKQVMIARQRKTLVVCQACHTDIHRGTLNKPGNRA